MTLSHAVRRTSQIRDSPPSIIGTGLCSGTYPGIDVVSSRTRATLSSDRVERRTWQAAVRATEMALRLRIPGVRNIERIDDSFVVDHIRAHAGTRASECEYEATRAVADHRIVELLPLLRPVEGRQEAEEGALCCFVLKVGKSFDFN